MGMVASVLLAAALAAVGMASVAAGYFELHMATAAAHVVTQDYDEAAAALGRAGRFGDYLRYLPGVVRASVDDVRAGEAAVRYWQRDYDGVAMNPDEPGAVNVDVELVAANARYRVGQPRMKDRQTSLEVLDEAGEAYRSVLEHSVRNPRAAYNYEFVSKQKQEVGKGRKPGPDLDPEGPLGRAGRPVKAATQGDFKILVPLESPERDKAAAAGKAAPRKRKG